MARTPRKWNDTGTVVTDGRFSIRRHTSRQLRAAGRPAFLPYALYDEGEYVKHFPNVPQAKAYADAHPQPKEEA